MLRLTASCQPHKLAAQPHAVYGTCVTFRGREVPRLQAQHQQDMCRHGCSAQARCGAVTHKLSQVAAG